MTCDEAIRAIEAMIDREIDDDERLHLEAHLAGCEACRREVEERRAFSDRLGRDLNDAFRASAPAAPRVVVRPRRMPWARWAAVIVVGFAMGYAGAATGFFTPASAEAREVAKLSALKEAYEHRDRELAARLEREALALDHRASRAPEGPKRDAVTLCVMNAVTGLAEPSPVALPPDSAGRARFVAERLSSKKLSERATAVRALGRLPSADVPHIEEKLRNLNGTNRTLAELYVLAHTTSAEPAIVLELQRKGVRFVQFQNAVVRVEEVPPSPAGAAPSRIYEDVNLLAFRAKFPEVSDKLGLKGSDANFVVGGVVQKSPAVDRPVMYVPAVVWSAPSDSSGDLVEAMSVQAVMAECSRAGASVEEAERHGKEVMRRVHATTGRYGTAVRPDPARVKAYLSQLRKVDEARLTLTREQLNDQLAALERRILELERRLECLQKAAVTLDYQAR